MTKKTPTPKVISTVKTPAPTTRTVGTNSTRLPWPQDTSGSTSELRRGAARAIGRIGGDEKNLQRVLETLEVIAAYARESCVEQAAAAQARVAAADARNENARRVERERLKAQVALKTAEVKRVAGELEALKASKA